jgi:hypothetical protein
MAKNTIDMPTSAKKAMRDLLGEKKVSIHFYTSKEFHKKVKGKANDEGISITELVGNLLEDYLSK